MMSTRPAPGPVRALPAWMAAALASCLCGCLYTSHHFNSGRVLEPGQTAVTLGLGSIEFREADCPDHLGYYNTRDEHGNPICIQGIYDGTGPARQDTILPSARSTRLPKLSLGYRLGVRGAWGPLAGVELGWHLEMPTNPGSVEFDLKLGLPPGGRRFQHALSAGWIVGMWADNSLFLEYAASRSFGAGPDAHALYGSLRLTRLATQPDEIVESDPEPHFVSHRRMAQQGTLGFHLRLPEIPLVPDFLSPQVTLSTPYVPIFEGEALGKKTVFDVNLGMGWRF